MNASDDASADQSLGLLGVLLALVGVAAGWGLGTTQRGLNDEFNWPLFALCVGMGLVCFAVLYAASEIVAAIRKRS